MTRSRNLLLLVILFAVLLAAALLQGSPTSQVQMPPTATITTTPDPLSSGTLLRIFPDLAVLDIQGIRLQDPNTEQSLTLARDAEGNWTAPDQQGQLDTDAASAIARTIVLLPYGRSINITAQTRLEDYGFAPNGKLFISIITRSGENHVVAVGDLAQDVPVYFALVDERDEIFQVERGAVDYLTNFLLSPPINLTN